MLTVTKLINKCGQQGYSKVPAHSLLEFYITPVTSNIQVNNGQRQGKEKGNSAKVHSKFQVKNLPDSFLNNKTTAAKLSKTLDKSQHSIDAKEKADEAYKHFAKFIKEEMEDKLKL